MIYTVGTPESRNAIGQVFSSFEYQLGCFFYTDLATLARTLLSLRHFHKNMDVEYFKYGTNI